MAPFQVIQDTPKPDPISGFMQGYSWSQDMIDQRTNRRLRLQQAELYRRNMQQQMDTDQWKLFQLQEETQRRRLASTKVAEVIGRAVSNKWSTEQTMGELAKVRDFAETEIGLSYADQWMKMNDPYYQARLQAEKARQSYYQNRPVGGVAEQKRVQLEDDLANGLITQEQFDQAIQYGYGITARPAATVDKYSAEYLSDQGLTPDEIRRVQRIRVGLEPRASTTAGTTEEKSLSYWLTQRKKTLDWMDEPIDTSEMNKIRETANKKIDEILTRMEQPVITPQQQYNQYNQYNPLAYEPSPGEPPMPSNIPSNAPQPTQAAPVTVPAGYTPDEEQAAMDALVNLRRKLKREPTIDELEAEIERIVRRRGGK